MIKNGIAPQFSATLQTFLHFGGSRDKLSFPKSAVSKQGSRTLTPDYEVIVCAPGESFRWNVHDYPHPLAKWHYHPEYELHLIQETSGRMMIGDYIGPFDPGCLVLTGPNLPHNWVSEIAPGERAPDRDMLIQFTPDFGNSVCGACAELSEVQRLLEDSAYGIEFIGTARTEGAKLLREIGKVFGTRRLILFLELMDLLARTRSQARILSRYAPADGTHTTMSKKLQVAIGFIYDNYTSEVRLEDVAEKIYMEQSTFSRFFKKQTGHTFSRFVNQLRVHHACRLLSTTNRSITSICYEAGFNNTANFNRQFVSICLETPSQYRISAQKITAPEGQSKA